MTRAHRTSPLRTAIVTGSRAEFGLLAPVIEAIAEHPDLEPLVCCAGSHFLPPSETWREVAVRFPVSAVIPMQQPGETSRVSDAHAFARGCAGFAQTLEDLAPDWLLVLGDRIEPFAAASAASIAGVAVAHIHGGDRAEGVADEAMRHAISKLAHLHLPATDQSAQRLARMGERPEHIITVGSPAAIGIHEAAPLGLPAFDELGAPAAVILHHPCALAPETEHAYARAIADSLDPDQPVLWLHPNFDPGRDIIFDVIRDAARILPRLTVRDHLPHAIFRSLLASLATRRGVLIGNSSAGLIEAALLRCPAVNVGPRQAGRECPDNVIHAPHPDADALRESIRRARNLDTAALTHPYGPGDAHSRIAAALASLDPHDPALLRKHCVY